MLSHPICPKDFILYQIIFDATTPWKMCSNSGCSAKDDLDLFCANPFGLLHRQKDEDLTSGEDCTNPLITKG